MQSNPLWEAPDGRRCRRSGHRDKALDEAGITFWLKVRILPSPPGSLSNRNTSVRLTKGPQLAGSDLTVLVSAETFSRARAILGKFVSGPGNPVSRKRRPLQAGAVRMWRLCPKSERSQGQQVDWMDLPFANTDCRTFAVRHVVLPRLGLFRPQEALRLGVFSPCPYRAHSRFMRDGRGMITAAVTPLMVSMPLRSS